MTDKAMTIKSLFPGWEPSPVKPKTSAYNRDGSRKKPVGRKHRMRKAFWIDFVREWGVCPHPEQRSGRARFMHHVAPHLFPTMELAWRYTAVPWKRLKSAANFDIEGPVHEFHLHLPNEGSRPTGYRVLVDATRGKKKYVLRKGGKIID